MMNCNDYIFVWSFSSFCIGCILAMCMLQIFECMFETSSNLTINGGARTRYVLQRNESGHGVKIIWILRKFATPVWRHQSVRDAAIRDASAERTYSTIEKGIHGQFARGSIPEATGPES